MDSRNLVGNFHSFLQLHKRHYYNEYLADNLIYQRCSLNRTLKYQLLLAQVQMHKFVHPDYCHHIVLQNL